MPSARAVKLADTLAREEDAAQKRAAAARPLTPDERKRYEEGKVIFLMCAACHQPTGTGHGRGVYSSRNEGISYGSAPAPPVSVSAGLAAPGGSRNAAIETDDIRSSQACGRPRSSNAARSR